MQLSHQWVNLQQTPFLLIGIYVQNTEMCYVLICIEICILSVLFCLGLDRIIRSNPQRLGCGALWLLLLGTRFKYSYLLTYIWQMQILNSSVSCPYAEIITTVVKYFCEVKQRTACEYQIFWEDFLHLVFVIVDTKSKDFAILLAATLLLINSCLHKLQEGSCSLCKQLWIAVRPWHSSQCHSINKSNSRRHHDGPPSSLNKPVLTHVDSSCFAWLLGTVVERWSLTGKLSLSCERPAADGWPFMSINRPL